MWQARLRSPLLGHIHDRHKLCGSIAKHRGLPISEDVNPRAIRPDMLPKVAGAAAQIMFVSNRVPDMISVLLRQNVEQVKVRNKSRS